MLIHHLRMQVLSKRQMFVKSLRTSRTCAALNGNCKEIRISQGHNQKKCGVVTPHQIYLFGRKRPYLPHFRCTSQIGIVDKKSARQMPRPFRALRALWNGIGSADASPIPRASRALEGNRLGLRLASFARFARFGRMTLDDCMRTIPKLG